MAKRLKRFKMSLLLSAWPEGPQKTFLKISNKNVLISLNYYHITIKIDDLYLFL
jgi:hypothetical protein